VSDRRKSTSSVTNTGSRPACMTRIVTGCRSIDAGPLVREERLDHHSPSLDPRRITSRVRIIVYQ
jgi:hypothetical protein